jgi:hypothetical protein
MKTDTRDIESTKTQGGSRKCSGSRHGLAAASLSMCVLFLGLCVLAGCGAETSESRPNVTSTSTTPDALPTTSITDTVVVTSTTVVPVTTTAAGGQQLTPDQIDSVLLPPESYDALERDGWDNWGEIRNTGLIDFDSPDVCGQEPAAEGLTYASYRTAHETTKSGYAGSSLGTFSGTGAADWYNRISEIASACPGVRVTSDTGLADTGVNAIAIHIPGHSNSEWSSDADSDVDLVMFLYGNTVGMISGSGTESGQASGVRTLAAEFAKSTISLSP